MGGDANKPMNDGTDRWNKEAQEGFTKDGIGWSDDNWG